MSLAYTKALKMIRAAESGLGFKLLEPKVGGKGGGGSELTQKAFETIEVYKQFEAKVKKAADEGFEEYKHRIEKMR
jgi:molybdate transport system regulatory protein